MTLVDDTTGILDSRPAVRVGRRFLPVPAAALPPVPEVDGLVELPMAPGTPVHALQSGRVVAAASSSSGEIVIRVEDELRVVYRKLLPSSVTVGAGDTVDAGDVIGVVAAPAGGTLAALELGVQRPDSSWERVCDVIVGLPDPLELFLTPPAVAPPSPRARPSRVSRPASRSTRRSATPPRTPAATAPPEADRTDTQAATAGTAPPREATGHSPPPEPPPTPPEKRTAGAAKLASPRRGRPTRSAAGGTTAATNARKGPPDDSASTAPAEPEGGSRAARTDSPASPDHRDQPTDAEPAPEAVASSPARSEATNEAGATATPPVTSPDTPEPSEEPAAVPTPPDTPQPGEEPAAAPVADTPEVASPDAPGRDDGGDRADEGTPTSASDQADEGERESKASRLSGRRHRPRRRP